MTYEVIWEPHGVVVTYKNTLDSRSFMDSYIEVNRDIRYKSVKYQLVNTLYVNQVDINSHDMQLIADLDKSNSIKIPNLRFALVANLKALERLSHLYNREVKATSWKLAIFYSMEEARDWTSRVEKPIASL